MGILNVTPDSFADGGRFFDHQKAIDHGISLAEEGADILDIGGESTRPYSEKVSPLEEIRRVIPVIEALVHKVDIPVSIDTTKSQVAGAALKAGATMINDVSALRFDPDLGRLAAEAKVPVVLMHMKGTPENMQVDPTYDDLIPDIIRFLEDAVKRAEGFGIPKDRIIIDPGIGFGKTFDHNLEIIRDLSRFSMLGLPLLLGCSRKAFIGKILDKEPDDRDIGTMAAVSAGVLNGADMVRVHNVALAFDTVRMADAIRAGNAAENDSINQCPSTDKI
jgi:dihydropteroate synthase